MTSPEETPEETIARYEAGAVRVPTDQTVHPDADRWGGWSWREPSRGEHVRRCSYCGSVNPDDLAAEPTWRADWADRKYGWPHKFYVDIPNRNPEALFVVSSISRQPRDNEREGWVAVADLTDEQRGWLIRDGWQRADETGDRWVQFGTRPNHFGKFYSIHLRDAGLDPAVKQAIEQRCGLAFDFTDDGRVAWKLATAQEDPDNEENR